MQKQWRTQKIPRGCQVSSQLCDVTNQLQGSAEGTTILEVNKP